MRSRRFLAVAAAAAALLLTGAGCADNNPATDRAPGSAITRAEAVVLAGVLQRNFAQGGADVTVTAPYAETATTTMTGSVDFTSGTGTVDVSTAFKDGRPDDVRTVYFTRDQIITGNIPGLAEAMTAVGKPEVQYFRRDLDQANKLVDNLVGMLTRLATTTEDDPDNLVAAGYTWEGTRTIDGSLTSTYRAGEGGALVSVGVEDKLLHQFASTPVNSDFTATITLANHDPKVVTLPPEAQIANAADFPDIAASVGS